MRIKADIINLYVSFVYNLAQIAQALNTTAY